MDEKNIKNTLIIGVKKNGKYHYIGKTTRRYKGDPVKSDLKYQYVNDNIKEIFTSKGNVEIVTLDEVIEDDWYNTKLNEVVEKHAQNHPLRNADWMKEGRRGYWEGLERDDHTIQRLSESKFKRVLQYDGRGQLVKIWESGKEAAVEFFGDYQIIDGSGKTKLYLIIKNSLTKNKYYKGFYWFKEDTITSLYGNIPHKLDIAGMINDDKRNHYNGFKYMTHARRYTVRQFNSDGDVIKVYKSVKHAAFELKKSVAIINRLCRGFITNDYLILKYGPKMKRPINEVYPDYETTPMPKGKKKKNQNINQKQPHK